MHSEKLVKLKLIEAKFPEIQFLHLYDQKQSESKMVSSITTLGYLVMTLLIISHGEVGKMESKKITLPGKFQMTSIEKFQRFWEENSLWSGETKSEEG